MNNRVCYISRCYRGHTSAGSKAKTDVENILALSGAVNLGLKQSFSYNKVEIFCRNLVGVVRYIFALRKGDILFLQYPMKKYFTFVCRIAHLKGAKVVALIHDLGVFRRKRLTIEQEKRRLSNADFIIATNAKMKDWLLEQGLTKPINSLDVWDYLCDSRSDNNIDFDVRKKVVYAGALSSRKNSFMSHFVESIENFDFHLYGASGDYAKSMTGKNVSCHPFAPFEQLISQTKAHFALVWDGNSVETCDGDWGSYLSINTPHKISFYIRMGLPIIIWEGAAMADFIVNNGLGLTISSLRELDTLLPAIDKDEWLRMKTNVESVSEKIAQGYYIKTALEVAIEYINKN